MDQEIISQTLLDQMVSGDYEQMLKALIPYIAPPGQRILSVYAKASELANTLSLFSGRRPEMQISASSAKDPLEILNEIRPYSYGRSREQLDRAIRLTAMLEALQLMNESEKDGE